MESIKYLEQQVESIDVTISTIDVEIERHENEIKKLKDSREEFLYEQERLLNILNLVRKDVEKWWSPAG